MTAAEAIEYIEKGIWSTTRLGLERTYELLELLGNPQKKLKITILLLKSTFFHGT